MDLNFGKRMRWFTFFVFVVLISASVYAQTPNSPTSSTWWSDSFSVGGSCYCQSDNPDHNIGGVIVDTPAGQKTIQEVCQALPEPPSTGTRIYYNDIQCGNGPNNGVGDEVVCPGICDESSGGCASVNNFYGAFCNYQGPTWDLDAAFGNINSGLAPPTYSSTSEYWTDSFEVGGKCYCEGTPQANIASFTIDTPQGPKTVAEVCAVQGNPPSGPRIYYNTVQCGHPPAHGPHGSGISDEYECPGVCDESAGGCANVNNFYGPHCNYLGPTFDLTAFGGSPGGSNPQPVCGQNGCENSLGESCSTCSADCGTCTHNGQTPTGPNTQQWYSDSFTVNGACYCQDFHDVDGHNDGLVHAQNTIANGILLNDDGSQILKSDGSPLRVDDVCTKLPLPPAGERIYYNDVQCGNGPNNGDGAEVSCPGIVETEGSHWNSLDWMGPFCNYKGPKFDLTAAGYGATGYNPNNNNQQQGLGSVNPDPHNIPGRVEAEDFENAFDLTPNDNQGGDYRNDDGVDIETISGVTNVGWISDGEWLEYDLNVVTAGQYDLTFRVASDIGGGIINVLMDGNNVGTVNVGNTGGWHNWVTQSLQGVALSSGTYVMRLDIAGGNHNIDYIDFVEAGSNPGPVCGQNGCENGESCSSCPQDCGQCSDPVDKNIIPIGSGEPFHIVGSLFESNPKDCGHMQTNDVCTVSWTVRATGEINSVWDVFSIINSNTLGQSESEHIMVQISDDASCTPDAGGEICDGQDNDCDFLVDENGVCDECSVNSDCSDDGIFCNGNEICSSGSCSHSGNPCTAGEFCNEVQQCYSPIDPAINIDSPLEGEVITVNSNGDVNFVFSIANFIIGGVGHNHVHFYLNDDVIPYMYYGGDEVIHYQGIDASNVDWVSDGTVLFKGLNDGENKIRIVLVNADHSELSNSEASDEVIFDVSSTSTNNDNNNDSSSSSSSSSSSNSNSNQNSNSNTGSGNSNTNGNTNTGSGNSNNGNNDGNTNTGSGSNNQQTNIDQRDGENLERPQSNAGIVVLWVVWILILGVIGFVIYYIVHVVRLKREAKTTSNAWGNFSRRVGV